MVASLDIRFISGVPWRSWGSEGPLPERECIQSGPLLILLGNAAGTCIRFRFIPFQLAPWLCQSMHTVQTHPSTFNQSSAGAYVRSGPSLFVLGTRAPPGHAHGLDSSFFSLNQGSARAYIRSGPQERLERSDCSASSRQERSNSSASRRQERPNSSAGWRWGPL